MTKRLGHEVAVDGPSLLAERAAFAGLHRRGSVSVGGAARFERCGDGWVVLNLPRPEDVAALPALVEAAVDPDDWEALRRELRRRSAADLVQRGRLLGLAIARPDERPQTPAPGHEITEALRDWYAPGPSSSIFRRCGPAHSPVRSSPTQGHG